MVDRSLIYEGWKCYPPMKYLYSFMCLFCDYLKLESETFWNMELGQDDTYIQECCSIWSSSFPHLPPSYIQVSWHLPSCGFIALSHSVFFSCLHYVNVDNAPIVRSIFMQMASATIERLVNSESSKMLWIHSSIWKQVRGKQLAWIMVCFLLCMIWIDTDNLLTSRSY